MRSAHLISTLCMQAEDKLEGMDRIAYCIGTARARDGAGGGKGADLGRGSELECPRAADGALGARRSSVA